METKLIYKENQQFLFNIIVPVFNAEKYIEKCLNSIIKQSYKNFQVKVIDDCSTDSSYELALEICNSYENFDIRKNPRRLGALNNIYNLLSLEVEEPFNTIDILVDGDDYLYSGDVLDILYEKYLNTNCLITYGSYLSSKGVTGHKYPRLIRELNFIENIFGMLLI